MVSCPKLKFGCNLLCVCGRAAGDIRLELRGTDLLITGKQAMTGGFSHALLVYTCGLLG